MNSKEKMLKENHWNQRMGRSGGHITENRGLVERDDDGRAGQHGLNGGTCRLECRQGREIETCGRGTGTEAESGL